jgi:hypothetical protein
LDVSRLCCGIYAGLGQRSSRTTGERKMRKFLLGIFLVTSCLLAENSAEAQEKNTIVPIKEYIDASGEVDIIVSIYDQPKGGSLLFRQREKVIAEDGLFNDVVEVPSWILKSYSRIFLEFAKASSPFQLLADDRLQFMQPGTQAHEPGTRAYVTEDASFTAVCFTCGGTYPIIVGAIATRIGGQNYERGRSCAGALAYTTRDSRPWICEQ